MIVFTIPFLVSDREPIAYRLAKVIKRARRQMSNAVREQVEPIGTTLHAVQIIKLAVAQGQLSQLELARQVEQEPAALCRLVADLESKRLVVRRRDPEDNRRVLVAATPAGEALLARAQPRVRSGLEGMIRRLTRDEQVALCELLEKLAPDDEAPQARTGERGTSWRLQPAESSSEAEESSRDTSPTRLERRHPSRGSSSSRRRGASTITSRT